MGKSIILVGYPDSGKSNFVGRLWLALQGRKFNLIANNTPDDIKYVEEMAAYLLQGRFAPRTDQEDFMRHFKVSVKSKNDENVADILIPDVSGELWKKAVETLEIPEKWLSMLRSSSGALLFVRVLSDLNVQPLDWVNSQRLLQANLGSENQSNNIPTQICLIELLRFLEETMISSDGKDKPKVAIIVTAWDLLNKGDAAAGPHGYLKSQFPMFAGRILDTQKLEIKVFGSSIVGGDFTIPEFVEKYLENGVDNAGFIITKDENENLQIIPDITTPIGWLLGRI